MVRDTFRSILKFRQCHFAPSLPGNLQALGSREVDHRQTSAESCQQHKRALLRVRAESEFEDCDRRWSRSHLQGEEFR